MAQRKYCTKCGNELDIDDVFCEKCGSKCKSKDTTVMDDEFDITIIAEAVDVYGEADDFTPFEVEIPNGKRVVVQVPNSITPNVFLKLKGLGKNKDDGTKGDAYLKFEHINYHLNLSDYKSSELKSLKCPNCGGSLDFDDDHIDTCNCEYCGSTIFFEGLSDESYRSKVKIKEMNHEETMLDKKTNYKKELEEQRHKHRIDEKVQTTKNKIIIGVLTFLAFFTVSTVGCIRLHNVYDEYEKQSIKQEKKLERIVEEVKELCEEEKWDEAYLKAKEIRYTENWSSEIEEKWNEERRAMIDYVIRKEKKATGKSTHKPEKKGLFD